MLGCAAKTSKKAKAHQETNPVAQPCNRAEVPILVIERKEEVAAKTAATSIFAARSGDIALRRMTGAEPGGPRRDPLAPLLCSAPGGKAFCTASFMLGEGGRYAGVPNFSRRQACDRDRPPGLAPKPL